MENEKLKQFRAVLEKQEEEVLKTMVNLPNKDQKMLLASWREIKDGKLTAEQFRKRLENYASRQSNNGA